MDRDMIITIADLSLPSYFHAIFDKVDGSMMRRKIFEPFEAAKKDPEVVAVFVEACVILGDHAWPLDRERLDFALDQWTWFCKVERRFSETFQMHQGLRLAVKELAQEITKGKVAGMGEQYLQDVLRFEFGCAAYRITSYPHEAPMNSSAFLLSAEEGTPFFTPFADMDSKI